MTTASEATLQRVPQIQLCRDSFKQLALQEQWTTSSFQEAACSSSLSTKALDSKSFQEDSVTAETYSQETSKKAAWKKRPSGRQLRRQQLGRSHFQQGSFTASSLTEETFRQATSKTAPWKKRPSARQLQRPQLDEEDFSESSLHGTLPSQLGRQQLERHFAWQLSLEQPSFQTRTSSTELSQLERTALTTELSQLERTALTTELAQLQPSSFGESSFDSLESPASEKAASTAQLCFKEASFSFLLGGPCLKTSRRRGGVLSNTACRIQLTLTSLSLAITLVAQASPP